jgi:hypothetical protein
LWKNVEMVKGFPVPPNLQLGTAAGRSQTNHSEPPRLTFIVLDWHCRVLREITKIAPSENIFARGDDQ